MQGGEGPLLPCQVYEGKKRKRSESDRVIHGDLRALRPSRYLHVVTPARGNPSKRLAQWGA